MQVYAIGFLEYDAEIERNKLRYTNRGYPDLITTAHPTEVGPPFLAFHSRKEALRALQALRDGPNGNNYADCVVVFFNRDTSLWEEV